MIKAPLSSSHLRYFDQSEIGKDKYCEKRVQMRCKWVGIKGCRDFLFTPVQCTSHVH
jgi:hypothetical protein